MTNRQEFKSYRSDKGAICYVENDLHRVVFGRWEQSNFVVAFSKASKTYKRSSGASRAISKWLNG